MLRLVRGWSDRNVGLSSGTTPRLEGKDVDASCGGKRVAIAHLSFRACVPAL